MLGKFLGTDVGKWSRKKKTGWVTGKEGGTDTDVKDGDQRIDITVGEDSVDISG